MAGLSRSGVAPADERDEKSVQRTGQQHSVYSVYSGSILCV